MKKFALFFLSFLLFFAGGFFLARFGFHLPNRLTQKETSFTRFSPAAYPIENHPFAIVIVGRNNGAFLEKTLKSVFSQKYENFRLIYIDDASNDGSFEMARDLVLESGFLTQVTLVQNGEILGPVANLFRAVEVCEEEEIVVVLNGEDRLAHEWVLDRLNRYYANPDLWLTFGQYVEYPTFKEGDCRPLEGNEFRSAPFTASHLKTFYAALFKQLREYDLTYQGKYVSAAAEMTYMIPLLEMAKDHSQFLPEILYLSLSQPEENQELQAKIEKHIRTQDPYRPLTALFQIYEIEPEAVP